MIKRDEFTVALVVPENQSSQWTELMLKDAGAALMKYVKSTLDEARAVKPSGEVRLWISMAVGADTLGVKP